MERKKIWWIVGLLTLMWASVAGQYMEYIDTLGFDKVNVHAITPHRLIFSKNGDYLVVIHYDEYHEDDGLFFVDGKKYTLLTIKKYIRNYFKNNSNINDKINNK